VVFTSAEIAHILEDTQADLRLLAQHPGLCGLIDGRTAYIGGRSPNGPVARVDGTEFTQGLEALAFGRGALHVRPRAEAEAAIAERCGRCPACGERRRPRLATSGTWAVRCGTLGHPTAPLDSALVEAVLRAADVRCPDCGAQAVARDTGGRIFAGCARYGQGCRGRTIRLEQLFGTE
jgi:hypothetical protein